MDSSSDPRNKEILVSINGDLFSREQARISVFDSSVQGGDAVWEGLRVYDGRIFQLDAHLRRMSDSAKAMAFQSVPKIEEIKTAIFRTLKANNMSNNAHIRLTLTRGEKTTSGMSPEFNITGCTLIVLAEWKKPVYNNSGIRLITSSVCRNPPQCVDSKIHHNNLINNILAKIEANQAEVDDAIMLDIDGFVSETNATNIFLFKHQELRTPWADYCLPGITRGVVLDLARRHQIAVCEKRISLYEIYTADEVFVTGTMGEIIAVLEVDGRRIGTGELGSETQRIQAFYNEETQNEGEPII